MLPVLEDLAGPIFHAGQQGAILTALILALVLLFSQELRTSEITQEGAPGHNLTVDFFVMGPGTAGNNVANRRTEHPNWTLLLLEAGHGETALSQGSLGTCQMGRSFADWNYTTPQKNACKVLSNSTCYWPRGHLIGGSNAMDDFLLVRGKKMDYDSWDASGIERWAYSDCLPFFRRLEGNRTIHSVEDEVFYGSGGYQVVERPSYFTEVGPTFFEAGLQLEFVRSFVI